MRKESEIFEELAKLCQEPGYLHSIAFLSFRDGILTSGDELVPDDFKNLYGDERLIRTELSTMIGLAVQGAVDLSFPGADAIERQIDRTEALMSELHKGMSASVFGSITPEKLADKSWDPFSNAQAMREPIFYGGESAYGFQYREFAVRKYSADDEWLKRNKGFTIAEARDVVKAICDLQSRKLPEVIRAQDRSNPDTWEILPGFMFTLEELVAQTGLSRATAENVVNAFSLPSDDKNAAFLSLGDFNATNAFPILRAGPNSYLLLQQFSLLEALYETPFYWMSKDKGYLDRANEHRGFFTEDLSAEFLERVFGKQHVFRNVDIYESKDKRIGEIDVLVCFGDRVLALQCKSKRLTLEARKGNDLQIKDDFKKSVQSSYEQGLICSRALSNPTQYSFQAKDGRTVPVPTRISETLIFCVVADHYPALAFQARQFLKVEATDHIAPPFVLDVFALDAITEMLSSPLQFLSYANRRSRYWDNLVATHELPILGYHLKRNLWLDKKTNMMMLSDDLATDLDIAMLTRREGFKGQGTPPGILTKLTESKLGRLITFIEKAPDPATISLGFMLLALGEDSIRDLSAGMDNTISASKRDGKHHDFTAAIGGDTGLTVHCNDYPQEVASNRLFDYCKRRKYERRADSWFGVCLSPADGAPRLGVSLTNRWVPDESLEASARRLADVSKGREQALHDPLAFTGKPPKLGRNDPCSCGSGKKYKKCCLLRERE